MIDQRAVTKGILRLLERGSDERFSRDVVSRRPYTFVSLIYTTAEGTSYSGVGFSKVCYPDVWDENVGIDIATAKAAQELASNILI